MLVSTGNLAGIESLKVIWSNCFDPNCNGSPTLQELEDELASDVNTYNYVKHGSWTFCCYFYLEII